MSITVFGPTVMSSQVNCGMVSTAHQLKVLQDIVQGIPIKMMHNFISCQLATNLVLQNIAVFKLLFTCYIYKFISSVYSPLSPFFIKRFSQCSKLSKPLIMLGAKPPCPPLSFTSFYNTQLHKKYNSLSLRKNQGNWLEVARSSNGA